MTRENELHNARRTIDKAEGTLKACERYFAHQAEMHAQGHLSDRVMYPPIHSSITSVLHGINMFREAYPSERA